MCVCPSHYYHRVFNFSVLSQFLLCVCVCVQCIGLKVVVSVCVCVCECVRACMRACMLACVRACLLVCVCVLLQLRCTCRYHTISSFIVCTMYVYICIY